MTKTIGRLSSSSQTDLLMEWDSEFGIGRLQIASRPAEMEVSGKIFSDCHLIMATLRGGARRHRFRNSDNVVYEGPDRLGMISVLPANCERELELAEVAWTWGALFVPPAPETCVSLRSLAPIREPFILKMFREIESLALHDGGIDPLLASSMTDAAWRLICRKRLSEKPQKSDSHSGSITTWRLRRLKDFVEGHLDERITVASLARVANMSERQLHRSLLHGTGQTPLAFVTQIRLERAKQLLTNTDQTIAQIALAVGFISQSHLARVFRQETGLGPRAWRKIVSDA